MVSNCANPACATPLRYLRDGRLFQFEVKAVPDPAPTSFQSAAKKVSRGVWHFWLCGHCSSNMTLEFDQLKGLKLRPLHHSCSHLAS